jgi:hypothetical protein
VHGRRVTAFLRDRHFKAASSFQIGVLAVGEPRQAECWRWFRTDGIDLQPAVAAIRRRRSPAWILRSWTALQ